MTTKRMFLTVLSILALLLSCPVWNGASASPTLATPTSSILYVMSETSGTCRGSWENACDLQTALNAAEPGDEIWAAKGIYYPGPSGNYTATFQLKSGVALYGGFSGIETEREQRDWVGHMTILSGEIDRNNQARPSYTGNSNHVVSSYGVTETAVLDGFTITAGYANYGGGMYNENSSPTLSNIIFSGNTAGNGGGMYSSGSPTLSNVVFSSNGASNGGGMYSSGNPILFNVTFSNNTASYNGCGGGMYSSGNPSLSNVTFSGNIASNGGGMCSSGSPILSYITFSRNGAGWMKGEGIGGGMNSSGNPSLSNVTFYHNSAGMWGGGMNSSGNPNLSNVTFSDNYTVYGNGGGIFIFSDSFSLTNSILWNNTPDQIGEYYYYINTVTVTYSDIQGGFSGNGNIDKDPLLRPLADNGGYNWTQALPFGSPAIDVGDPQNCPATDQRGVVRPVDGDMDGVAICDMGAYELRFYTLYLPRLSK